MTSYRKSFYFFGITLLFFVLARTALLAFYPEQFKSLGLIDILQAFLMGLRFDISSATVFLAIPLLAMNLPGKLTQNRPIQYLLSTLVFIIVVVLAGFLVCDVLYFDYVKRHITYEMFLLVGDDFILLAGMALNVYLVHAIIAIFVLIALGWLWYKIAKRPFRAAKLGIKSILVYLAFIILLVIAGRGGIGYKPVTIIDAFSSGSMAFSNLVLNGVFSVSHSMLRSQDIDHHHFDQEEALKILGMEKDFSDFPFQKTNQGTTQPRYNLVFFLIESLSFKYVDAFAHNDLGVTPNLDRLAKEGLTFTNFFAAGQRSLEGIQATLTGIPSIVGMPTIGIGLVANYSKLGQIAADNGYSTFFAQSPLRRSLRMDSIAGSLGFQNFYGKEDYPLLLDYADPDEAKYGWDYETLMFAAEKLEKSEKPFFMYIYTSTTHTPFPRLPEKLEKYPYSSDKEEGFLNTINYIDWSVGEFLKRLEKTTWFDNTIFVITADHALAHYRTGAFYDKFHIPLIIYAPKIIKPGVDDRISSQLDLFPTLVDLLDLKATFSSFGSSLVKQREAPFALVRDGSVVGIIAKDAYLSHSLHNMLETGPDNNPPHEDVLQELENKLLASDQLVFELIQANQWAN